MQPGVQTIRPAINRAGRWSPAVAGDGPEPGRRIYSVGFGVLDCGRPHPDHVLKHRRARRLRCVIPGCTSKPAMAGRGIEPRHAGHEPARLPLSYPSDDFMVAGRKLHPRRPRKFWWSLYLCKLVDVFAQGGKVAGALANLTGPSGLTLRVACRLPGRGWVLPAPGRSRAGIRALRLRFGAANRRWRRFRRLLPVQNNWQKTKPPYPLGNGPVTCVEKWRWDVGLSICNPACKPYAPQLIAPGGEAPPWRAVACGGAPRIGCDPRFPGFEGTFYARNYRKSPGRDAAGYPLRDEQANPVTLVAGRGIEPRHAGHEPARLPLSYPRWFYSIRWNRDAS